MRKNISTNQVGHKSEQKILCIKNEVVKIIILYIWVQVEGETSIQTNFWILKAKQLNTAY